MVGVHSWTKRHVEAFAYIECRRCGKQADARTAGHWRGAGVQATLRRGACDTAEVGRGEEVARVRDLRCLAGFHKWVGKRRLRDQQAESLWDQADDGGFIVWCRRLRHTQTLRLTMTPVDGSGLP